MKRRHFLAWVSTASVSAAVGGLGTGCRPAAAAGGRIHLSPRRQGARHAVRVTLDLPAGRDLRDAPALVVIRDGVPDWSAAFDAKPVHSGAGRWSWEWVPPAVRPTALELASELVRYRVVALDERGRSLGLVSEPVEVVCAWRGWSS